MPVDGEPFRAELTAVDAKWQMTFGAGEGSRVMAASKLVRWGRCVELRDGPIVITADGGWLKADVLAADEVSLSVSSTLFGRLKLPLESIAGVVFDLPAGRQARDLLVDRVAAAKGSSDRLVLTNGDEIGGLIRAIDAEAVTLNPDVGPPKIAIERIAALIINPDLRTPDAGGALRVHAGFSDGTRLIATQLALLGDALQITTAAGQICETPADKLVFLQPQGGAVTYLSDLTPAGRRQEPYLSLPWPTYRRDRNVTGGRLRCGGQLYFKGVGVHGYSQLTYLLDRPYRRFDAELGVDDCTGGRGSVQFRVYVDRKVQHSGETILRGGDAPMRLSVDLSGAKRLDLIVDFADRADVQDHADWLDARLVP